MHQYNIDQIHLSQSPPTDRCPRFFQPKGLSHLEYDSDTPDEDDCFNDHDLKKVTLAMETDHFAKIVTSTQQYNDVDSTYVSDEDQPIISQAIIARLDYALKSTKFANNSEAMETYSNPNISNHHRPYPPVERTGMVHDHDRPFAEYGHLDAASISQEDNFDWNGIDNEHRRETNKKRMQCKAWAITCWSDVSKQTILEEIRRQFRDERLQYVCVASEKNTTNNKTHLHVQIIAKEKINKKSWFLDDIAGNNCYGCMSFFSKAMLFSL
ncbi:unnamed protein product [Rotaria sp. Silwood2]|nr:unnamed protein product [Rotaria sp. Silwood2]